MITQLDKEGTDFLHQREALRLKAYQDGNGVWTIGWGNTYYENGQPVRAGDVITAERAESLYKNIVKTFEKQVVESTKGILSQKRFNACVSLCYNIGAHRFATSTLVKKIIRDQNDHRQVLVKDIPDSSGVKLFLLGDNRVALNTIEYEFLRWCNDGGKRVKGLYNRRKMEWKMYVEGGVKKEQALQTKNVD